MSLLSDLPKYPYSRIFQAAETPPQVVGQERYKTYRYGTRPLGALDYMKTFLLVR
jgi:hypothetical protein